MNYILSNLKIKNCTKEILKIKILRNSILNITKIIALIALITFAMMLGSYQPVYEVYLDGERIGFVSSRIKFEESIKNEVLTPKDSNAVAVDLKTEPTYQFQLARFKETNEIEIINRLSEETITTYRVYAININNETKAYVSTWEEAEEIVTEMQQEYQESTHAEITVTEKYTENPEEINVDELEVASANIDNDLRVIREEQEKIALATFNGVYFSVKPVSGTITSRFGAVESVRNHTHKGMDIAAPAGTPIRAAADGKVICAGSRSGYGNLVIIEHTNGVKTYYGHCSKIYVSVGQEITAGDTIAAVGSTGNSTGNHLHFEIRLNDVQVNPQLYIYR